jgi:hypothetical protein
MKSALAAHHDTSTAAWLLLLLLAGVLWAHGMLWAETSSEAHSALEDMKLLSPGTGWALVGHRLFWTSDNGQNWEDITPGSDRRSVSKAYFFDAKTGWAILPGNDGGRDSVTVASTRNGGRTWENAQVAFDSTAQGRRLGRIVSLYFANAQQGWLVLQFSSSSNFSMGAAFRTLDGGLTWAALPSPPAAGEISFTTTQDGWMIGGPAGDRLWQTRDGGQRWQPAAIAAPADCTGSQPVYSLPFFTGASYGRMTATTVTSSGNCLIDYVTADGGQSWQTLQVSKYSAGLHTSVTIAGAQARHAYASGTEISIEQDGVLRQGALPAGLQPNGDITRAEFPDSANGWLNYSSGECQQAKMNCLQQSELLATVDGGKTFSIITPHPDAEPQTFPGDSSTISRSARAAMGLDSVVTPQASAGANTVVSNSSGFDLACAPVTTAMQTWWADSPYQDIGVYLGGCDVYCVSPNGQNTCASNWHPGTTKTVDSNLTSAWLASATKMGWGILPIWVGPQAPCIANASSYWTINNSDPFSTGAYQADLAIAQANALGITSGIVYYDMEGYTPDGGDCSTAVETFLANWTAELHAQGFESGLYGGISDFQTDYLALSPEPDAAWIAAWDSNNTIWNIGTLSNSYWPDNQRIHQWNSETNGETWGGVNLGGIDQNIVDAPVVGNWLATSPSFTLSNSGAITISTPGASGTSTISVTPSNGFTGVVTLSCSISGSAAIPPTCSVPASVTINGSAPGTATLTIHTTAATQARNLARKTFFLGGSGSIGLCILLLGIPKRRLSWRKFLGIFLLTASIGTIAGCGSGGSSGTGVSSSGGTTLGTYAITVFGVDQATGTIKSNTTVTAIVN